VSFGGPVDYPRGLVRLSHHVSGWENIPLADLLESEFGVPAMVDNDANAAVLGEAINGAGRGIDSLFYLTVSTGVGGGWILNDEVWRGTDSMAGEIGHTVVDPLGPVCLCGKRGCVERLASGPYLAQDTQVHLKEHPEACPIIRELVGDDLTKIDAVILSRAAEDGDPQAQSLISRAGWAVGVAIGNTANLINPQRFILGGGMTKAGPYFWETLINTARATALPEVHFDILPAHLGDDAPLWGAIRLAELALTR
jgi:glucokinase